MAVTPPARSSDGTDDPGVPAAAAKALELVLDGKRVDLGSGRAATVFIAKHGARVREGPRVSGVPTSQPSTAHERDAGVPLIDLGEVPPDHHRWPGQLVTGLGEPGRVPVEVIPLAKRLVMQDLKALGLVPALRRQGDAAQPFLSENGNLIIDCGPPEPNRDGRAGHALERALLAIAGVVDTGLLLGTADRVPVGPPAAGWRYCSGPEAEKESVCPSRWRGRAMYPGRSLGGSSMPGRARDPGPLSPGYEASEGRF